MARRKINATAVKPADKGIVGAPFEAADRTSKALATWNPSRASADGDLIPSKPQLDSRSRDVLRNDAYVQGGAMIFKDNIVGAYYALNAKPMAKLLGKGFDEKWEREFQEEVEARFTLWAESPDCWADAARTNTFTEMVRLAVGVHVACGEVLASVEWLRDPMRPFSTAIQMIDVDRLSNPNNEFWNESITGGVEKDARGAPIAYHIRMAHPSDFRSMKNMVWKRVPVRKPWGRLQMIHIFEQQRPDQTRGVAEMVAALKEIRMTKQFRDIVLQNAVVNATYAASIESDLPSAEVFAALGGGDASIQAMNDYLKNYLAQLGEYAGAARNLTIDGVKIPHLFPGTKLNLTPAGKGGPLGENFEASLLRYIASALGVNYEQLSRDYTNTNYSSARASMAETAKHLASVKRAVADRFATAGYRLWLEEAVNGRAIEALPRAAKQSGWLYSNQRLDALSACDWIGASRGQIDELKETQAAVLRLRYNLTTEEDEIARFGKDWRAVKKQRAREQAMDRDLKLEKSTDSKVDTVAVEGQAPAGNDQQDTGAQE